MKKNEFYKAKIESVTNEGMGVAKIDGQVVFVPGCAIGDELNIKIVKVNKNYSYGIIDEIIIPSPDRIEPQCPVYKKCGGCSFSHITYEAELKIKEQYVKDCFVRLGKIETEFEAIEPCDTTLRYRNKAQYPVGQADKAYCGFFAKHSHRIIECEDCDLQPKVFSEISKDVIDFINNNNIANIMSTKVVTQRFNSTYLFKTRC